jgi:myo-inositol-1(or 4)-monophosphatase
MLKSALLQAIHAGADAIRQFDDQEFKVSNKEGINNLVTEVDHAAEKAIMDVIRSTFPDHFILSEEAGEIMQDSAYKWIIDPIDGTVNFAHRIPICCISIGIEHNGEMVLGAVYNPFMNELYFAERGKGATLNERPISVSKKEKVENACLVTGFPYTYLDEPNGPLQVFERFIRKGIPVRRLGSAAIDHKLQAWDSAAGFIIVEEAGGKVTNLKGDMYSPYQPGIIASNGVIHDELLTWIEGKNI